MKVALIGASGTGGSRLAAELSRRGHQVTAIARHPEKVAPSPGVTAMKGDADRLRNLPRPPQFLHGARRGDEVKETGRARAIESPPNAERCSAQA
jgi:nucleoside-diphosphate-sugar epimerase